MNLTQAKQYVTYYTGLIRHGMQLVREERALLVRARQLLRKARHPAMNPRKAMRRNGTATRTEVRSPTRTSTHALTRGNTTLTITGNGNRVQVPKGKNPPGAIVYHRLLKIEAKKGPGHRCDAACKRADHSYFHDFGPGAVVYGMPDGSLKIRSTSGKRLWNFF